jgi:hypothetical protein
VEKRAVASAGNNKKGGQKGQTKSTSPVAIRKTTVDTETGSHSQKSKRNVSGATKQKQNSPASKKTLVGMQTGSPAQKSKRKVTGEIKKKKSPPQVSQKTEESEDSGEDSGEDIADDSESSSSSSVLQKQETSKQKSQMKNISPTSARKTSVDTERGSPAQKNIRKVTGVMQQKNISPASKKMLVETRRGSPTQKILPTSYISRAKEAQPSSLVAVGEQVTTTNLEPLTNVDHILPRSDQEILNRLLATLSSGGAVQPTQEQMQSAYRLIANMGTMGLLQQFGPTPNPTAEKQPLERQ